MVLIQGDSSKCFRTVAYNFPLTLAWRAARPWECQEQGQSISSWWSAGRGYQFNLQPWPESAASVWTCKGARVTTRLQSWWMSDRWEPCKTNLLYPCWYDCTLLQSESEGDGVLQRGKHQAELVGPSGSLSPAPLHNNPSVHPEAQSTPLSLPSGKVYCQHCGL